MSCASDDPLQVLSRLGPRAWLVGGALRDRLLERRTADYDVVVEARPRPLAKDLARAVGAHAFELSEGFGVWRVVAHDRAWQLDLLPLQEGRIEADLAGRDLTINAIAQPLGTGELIDPFGGLGDLRARRLRMVTPEAFARDPLRTLRLARLACELGFSVEPRTAAAAVANAPGLADVAPERVFAELRRIVAAPRAVDGLRLMDALQITPVVLPEVSALQGVEQSPYHHLDVHDHTLAVLAQTIELERSPEPALGAHAEAVSRFLAQPLANDLTRWQALRFGALLHDTAKPETRRVTGEGRVTFLGHDAAGAQVVATVLGRLRASDRLTEHVAALTRYHLRLGFLVHAMPLSRREVYRYLHDSAPVQIDVTVLSVADRLATRGVQVGAEAIAKHLQLADQLLGESLEWIAEPPRPPVRGDELARALGVVPGPELGRILAELQEASFAHEIGSREEAIERARELLRATPAGRAAGSERLTKDR